MTRRAKDPYLAKGSAIGDEIRKTAIAFRADADPKTQAISRARAEGMIDAVIRFEAWLAKGGSVSLGEARKMAAQSVPDRRLEGAAVRNLDHEARIRVLEGTVSTLSEQLANVAAAARVPRDEAPARSVRTSLQRSMDRALETPIVSTKMNGTRVDVIVDDPLKARGDRESLLLGKGMRSILKACAQAGDRGLTLMELTAVVDLRETSLRTYITELRGAGLLYPHHGERAFYVATKDGRSSVYGDPDLPIGAALLAVWLAKLSSGERKILAAVAQSSNGRRVADLVGDATGLKETSVRTYVTELGGRRLIRRTGPGRVELATILTDDWAKA